MLCCKGMKTKSLEEALGFDEKVKIKEKKKR
jgi:hypothetical protein